LAATVIRIRADQLDFARRLFDYTSDAALAAAMGVHRSTVSRARTTGIAGADFVTGLRKAFPKATFDDLFVIEDARAEPIPA
jgi:hypothetical protein